MWTLILLGALWLGISGIATFVLYRRDLVDDEMKARQLLVIWSIPLLGAAFSLMVAFAPEGNFRVARAEADGQSDTSAAIADTYDTIRHEGGHNSADSHSDSGYGA